jgi:hypothetical protein
LCPISPEASANNAEFLSANNSLSEEPEQPAFNMPADIPEANLVMVDSVSVKPPTFWAQDVELWFRVLESQFLIRSPPITKSVTKYYHAMSGMPHSAIQKIADIIRDPSGDPYERMKTKLIECYGRTPLQKSYDLLALPGLGDQRAQDALDVVLRLYDPQALLRAIFLRMLPPHLSKAVAGDNDDLSTIAKKIDRLRDDEAANKASAQINYIGPGPGYLGTQTSDDLHDPQVPQAAAVYKPPIKSGTNRDATGLCSLHKRHGKKAYSCRGAPCPMIGQTSPRPDSTAAGNASAGR